MTDVILNFAVMVLTGFLLSYLAVLVIIPWLSFDRMNLFSRRWILWCMALLPLSSALIGAAALLLLTRSDWGGSIGLSLPHWHHLELFSVWSWHGALLCVGLGAVLIKLLGQGRLIYRTERRLKLLRDISTSSNDGKEVYFESSSPQAFVAGVSNRMYLSTALLNQFCQQELAIIKRHEQAHIAAKDPLAKCVFSFLIAVFPNKIRARLFAEMLLVTEQIADQRSLSCVSDANIAATVMLKLAGQESDAKDGAGLYSAYSGAVLSARIHQLLADKTEYYSINKMLVISGLFLLGLICGYGVDIFHHSVEGFLEH